MPRPSAWARPSKAKPAEEVEQRPDGVGLQHDGVICPASKLRGLLRPRPSGGPRGRRRRDRSRRRRRRRRLPPSPSDWALVVVDDLQVGVGDLVGARGCRARGDRRLDGAPPGRRTPRGLAPRRPRTPTAASARPACPGSSAAVARSSPSWPDGRGAGQPRMVSGPPAAVAAARAAASARLATARRPSSERSLVSATPGARHGREQPDRRVVDARGLVRSRAGEARQQRSARARRWPARRRRRRRAPARARPARAPARPRSRHAHLHVAEARRRRAVRDGHDLARLALPAVRSGPRRASPAGRRRRRASPRSAA